MSRTTALRSWFEGWNPYDPDKLPPAPDGLEPIRLEESHTRRNAVRFIMAAFVAFLVWAAVAPLDAGVVVSGSVTVSGSRKSVQPLSGGVVTGILVREGARVKQGDVLVTINPLNSEANLVTASSQLVTLLATESRLLAERADREIRWDPELEKRALEPSVAEAKFIQEQLLRSRRGEFESRRQALESSIASLNRVISETRVQLDLVAQETESTIQLAKEGYVPESRANEMRRARSSLEAQMARLTAELSASRQNLAQLRATRLAEIGRELSEIQKNRESMEVREQSLGFERSLTEIKAPVSGVIVGMQVNTVGGVINAGQVLMEVLPEEASLIIRAEVPPNLIDKVRVGLEADMRFSAFNQNTTPVIPGVVRLVGADKITKPEGGEPFFLAQIATTDEGLKLLEGKRIQPGMPVEVVIKTGERTFLNYLLKPLTDRTAVAFKD